MKLTWQAVGLTGIIGALAVALAVLAKWSAGDVVAVVAVLASISGAAVAGNAAASGVSQQVTNLQAATTAQTSTLETVARRVNGELDARIEAGSRVAADLVVAELRAQGVIQ